MGKFGVVPQKKRVANRGPSKTVWVSDCGQFKLSQRQKLFCDNYLAQGLVDATTAYLAAGYKPGSMAAKSTGVNQLLKHKSVRHYLELRKPDFEGKVLLTRDYVVEKLKGVVESSRNDSARVGALKQLGQFLGMWVERTEVTGKDGEPLHGGGASLRDVDSETLLRVKELLSARKPSDDGVDAGGVSEVN